MISFTKAMISVAPFCNSSALSLMARATVRMVPSFGFITALYAVSVARTKAAAIWGISTVFFSAAANSRVNPRNNCERMTPELPRAPRREPEAIALHSTFISSVSSAATSLAADIIVMVMLVPVSPSGTGNTFSSLIHSFLDASSLAAAKKHLRITKAFNS